MNKIKFIDYNKNLKNYSRINRNQNNMTKSEGLMRNMILKGNRLGYRFLRQKIIGSFILDFYCSKLRLGIEIDGGYHEEMFDYDQSRESLLLQTGIKIIRYTSYDVEKNLDGVMEDLKTQIREREIELKLNLSSK
ncbi:endonuclease domain-containing protein [Candidatus Gracilibacteria bacterium]|nr:endonuclease domain-containing protein [Candidatus Gracilibacteria bacterium]